MADSAGFSDDTLSKNKLAFIMEVKLSVNQQLFDKNLITEEMYNRAKEQIIRKVC